ncbi:MAG: hypothetical protein ACE5RN_04350 [Nitrosopumilaceae archaeon]
MSKEKSKLDIKDIATVEIINNTESESSAEFNIAKEKISNLKNDAAETVECLTSINSTIKEHLLRMEKLKSLEVI